MSKTTYRDLVDVQGSPSPDALALMRDLTVNALRARRARAAAVGCRTVAQECAAELARRAIIAQDLNPAPTVPGCSGCYEGT